MYQKICWVSFLTKFQGFNIPVTRAFDLSFDGLKAYIGDLEVHLSKEFISRAKKIP